MTDAAAIVFIVDDDPSIRKALGRLLRSLGFQVETFPSAQKFLEHELPDAPGCLVLDVRMPGLDGLELQRSLSEAHVTLPIIFITGHGDIPMTVRAMKAGAVEFLPKPFREQDLLDALNLALDRDRTARKQRAELAVLRARYDSLTPREQQVMGLLVSGLLNKEIAATLGVSEVTIKVHRGQIMQKMQAGSLATVVRMAERLGIPASKS